MSRFWRRSSGIRGPVALALLASLASGPSAAGGLEPAAGAELYAQFDCSGCHEVAMVPGMLVIPLENLSTTYTAASLAAFLASPPEPMPAFEMSDEERRMLAGYLLERHP